MNQLTQHYTPGYSRNATAFMAARDLETHGFFLAPLLQPGFNVLDAGCGPATITTGIAETVFPGRVTAVDTASQQLAQARTLCEGREIMNLDFVQASATALPFARESFDLVFAHALIEHLAEPARAMQEFHRVVRPGGFLAVCSPDWDQFEISPLPAPARRAINAYRDLMFRHGGHPDAGARLREWTAAAGFTPLVDDAWMEHYDDPGRIADFLALQLNTAGENHHADALRAWSRTPGATFRQCWKFTTAVRADADRPPRFVKE